MEVWLSPALGFDYPNRTARIYGPGDQPDQLGFLSGRRRNVRPRASGTRPRTAGQSSLADPRALSPLEVVARFEENRRTDRSSWNVLPELALRAQRCGAGSRCTRAFAGLKLGLSVRRRHGHGARGPAVRTPSSRASTSTPAACWAARLDVKWRGPCAPSYHTGRRHQGNHSLLLPDETGIAARRPYPRPHRLLRRNVHRRVLTAAVAAGIPAGEILKVYTGRSHEIFTPSGVVAEAKRVVEGFMYDPTHLRDVLTGVLGAAAAWTMNDCPSAR